MFSFADTSENGALVTSEPRKPCSYSWFECLLHKIPESTLGALGVVVSRGQTCAKKRKFTCVLACSRFCTMYLYKLDAALVCSGTAALSPMPCATPVSMWTTFQSSVEAPVKDPQKGPPNQAKTDQRRPKGPCGGALCPRESVLCPGEPVLCPADSTLGLGPSKETKEMPQVCPNGTGFQSLLAQAVPRLR